MEAPKRGQSACSAIVKWLGRHAWRQRRCLSWPNLTLPFLLAAPAVVCSRQPHDRHLLQQHHCRGLVQQDTDQRGEQHTGAKADSHIVPQRAQPARGGGGVPQGCLALLQCIGGRRVG